MIICDDAIQFSYIISTLFIIIYFSRLFIYWHYDFALWFTHGAH